MTATERFGWFLVGFGFSFAAALLVLRRVTQ